MSLASCMKKAGKALSAEDKAAIIDAARGHREAGKSASDAAKLAVSERIEHVNALLVEAGKPKPVVAEPVAEVEQQVPETPMEQGVEPENQESQQTEESAPRPSAETIPEKSQSTAEPKTAAKIEDFGEKIGGARKDTAAEMRASLNSVADGDIASQPLSKIWPAQDYQKLIDGGMSTESVAAMRAFRDELPAKPRAPWKVKRWAEQVKTLRDLTNRLLDGTLTMERLIKEDTTKGGYLRGVLGRVDLYLAVGHSKSLEGLRFQWHHYGLYKGKENVKMWVVEQNSATTAFNTFPREIATGTTKDEALAAFKEKYASLDTEKAERQISFNIFSERGKNGFFIGKKIGRNVATMEGPFATIKEARDYRDNNLAALQDKLEKYKEIPRERADINQPRVGVDMRNGQDVTPEMFGETFGFKGVEFGNWVEQKRRQRDINDAFDALMDMAAVLGVPAKSLSLNGQLGLAFGARGSGGVNPAAAHYEPGRVVINLTKKEGAGSLGHEWWHALDNYFSRERKRGGDMMTTASDVSAAARGGGYSPLGTGVRNEMIEAFGAVVKAIRQTAMKERSFKLDAKRSTDYWVTGHEMSARAFESYLIAKLQDQNAANDYLANVVEQKTWDAMAALGMQNENSYPYPTAAEMPAIRAGFDHFFDTIQTKETEDGNVAMFARSDPNDRVSQPYTAPDESGQSITDADKRDVANLGRRVAAYPDQPTNLRGANAYKAVMVPDSALVGAIAGAFGKRAVGFRLANSVATDRDTFTGIDGATLPERPNTIFINAESARPHLALLGHELAHELRRDDPALFQELVSALSPYVKKDVYSKEFGQERVAQYLTDGAAIREEFIGEVLSDGFMEPKFWNALGEANPSLLKRIYGAVSNLIAKAKAAFGTMRRSEKYLTDFDAVMRIAGETMARYATTEKTRQAEASSDEAIGATATGTATPFDKLLHAGIAEGRTTTDTLKAIQKASKNPFYRELAGVLLKAGVNPALELGNPKGLKFSVKNRAAESFAAAFFPKANKVQLFTDVNAERNVLHEIMHAATFQAIRKPGMASGQLRALFSHVKKSGQLKGMYGMENMDEFIAEAFSNPKFQAALKGVDAAKLTGGKIAHAFDWFVNIVRSILGLPKGTESALSQVIEIGSALIDQQRNMTFAQRASDRVAAMANDKTVVGNTTENPADGDIKGSSPSRLVDTEGMTREQARTTIQSRAESLASTLREHGFDVGLQHSGSIAGASSYLSVYDPQTGRFIKDQIRVSGHSKGAFNSLTVHSVATDEQAQEVVDTALAMRARGPTEKMLNDQVRAREIDAKILARAQRRSANGQSLTKIEKAALDSSNTTGRSADEVVPAKQSSAIVRLNKTMRAAGWEVEFVDIDLTADKPKASIRINRDDGRFVIANVDSLGRANIETFQRERSLKMNSSTKGRRPLSPMIDDTFLGRQKFEGARSMLRGMTNYIVDNSLGNVSLAEVRSAWAGIMSEPTKQIGPLAIKGENPNEPTTSQDGDVMGNSLENPNFAKWFGDSKVVDADGAQAGTMGAAGQGETINIDGTERSRNNSDGAPIATTDEALRNFWRWFGDSKVVDPQGRPRVVYHGTGADIAVFDKKRAKDGRFGKGFYFADDATSAAAYAAESQRLGVGSPNVMPVYLRIEAPGTDGVRYGKTWVAFEPDQIKSALGNDGGYSLDDDSIMGNVADSPGIQDQIRQRANDLLSTKKTFNWWHNTVGTQYAKAEKDADFKRVFDTTQEYISDVSRLANAAADMAASLLPKTEGLRDLFKKDVTNADRAAIAKPIYQGTLTDQRVYSDQELREQFKLTDAQIGLYKEHRAAINQSLDDLFKTDALRYVGKDAKAVRAAVMASTDAYAAADIIAAHLDRIGNRADIDVVQAKAARVQTLKEQGYAPLMRFGRYAVYVTDPNGETISFTLHENERDATKQARLMQETNPGATVQQSVLSEEAHKLYAGMEPETLELFAEMSGAEETPAFQQYLKMTKSNRSAMKRLIERKGIAGFDQDPVRSLAAFITSNARAGSKNLHFGDMLQAAGAIPREKGDVIDQAVKLVKYVQDPQQEAQAIRGLLFVNYIGGSVASAAVNLTQPLTMTFPYLSQFGTALAVKEMTSAMRTAIGKGIKSPELAAALKRAEQSGIVAPQEIHQLEAEASQRFGSNQYVRKGMYLWGSMFSLAEQYNRRVTFIAAYNVAKANKMADPFAFAEKAVGETQGIYNKGNRPNWARGAVGATIFTFKQFSISYLEFLTRLPRKEQAIALGILLLTAGIQGMPGADDADDIIDTIGQGLGYDTNVKAWKTDVLSDAIGRDGAEFVMRGGSAIPGFPIDVAGRMGMGNLVPGTGVLLKSKTDKGGEFAEPLGAAGSFAKDILSGKIAPLAIRNLQKAADMYSTGMYRDEKGRKVIDADGFDALVKGIGFQPAAVARDSRTSSMVQQSIGLAKNVESDIAQKWAEGIVENDPAKSAKAAASLMEWNAKNPNSPIAINQNQIQQRVMQMMLARQGRVLKSAPKELRAALVDAYQ